MIPENTQENADKCICPQCTVYTDCNRKEDDKLFCARGKSDCQMDSKKMCICGDCPVHMENELTEYYYCLKGEAEK